MAYTELDYRTRRGVGIGEGFQWTDPDARWAGSLATYYASDDEPLDSNDDPLDSGISSDRYRLRLRHHADLTERGSLMLRGHYLSDADILEDFFEDEYRDDVQPDNHLVYSYRGDAFTASAQLRSRLNDFYTDVNRLPEVSLDAMRQQLGSSALYYEGRTAAAFLQKAWENTATNETDYSAFRFDSGHMVSYPERYFAFLNVIPRAGYRATYYSETRGTQVTTTTNTVVDELGRTNTTEATLASTTSQPGELRSRIELGAELSYRAFATWDSASGVPLRHVIEPYLNYTFVPEPTLLPENIYQFDEVDQLTEDHSVKLGARNKIQTKRGQEPFDYVDVDVYGRFLLERDEGEDVLASINAIGELRPTEWFKIRFDAETAPSDGLRTLNARIEALAPDLWSGGIEYRFRKDDSRLLLADLTLFPKARWTCNGYGRYEMDDSRVEEVGGYVQKNYDCMSLRIGTGYFPGYTRSDGTVSEDDWRVVAGVWFTAFTGESPFGRYTR